MNRKEYKSITTVYKHSNWILFCCSLIAILLNYLFIAHLKTMNIQETTTYTLDSEEIRSAIYDAFVYKLKGLGVNAYFDNKSIEIDEYGNTATLTLTESSEI